MKNNIIHVDFKKIEQAEDHNCEAIQINTRQTNHDKSEQEIFNEFMPFDAA
jgi:hypothetical protein